MRIKNDFFSLFLLLSLFFHAGLMYVTDRYYHLREERQEEVFLVNLADPLNSVEPYNGDENKRVTRTGDEIDFRQRLNQESSRVTTVSLDTQEQKYAPYLIVVKRKIDLAWDYPERARRARMDGSLALRFSILRTGTINQLRVLRSSGYEPLDDEAVRAIAASSPFPPLPGHIEVPQLNVQATFEYRIEQE